MSAMRYVVTKYRDGVLSFISDAMTCKMESVVFTHSDENMDDAKIGDIFVAKVKNVARQINAAFIDYAPNKKGYLPIRTDSFSSCTIISSPASILPSYLRFVMSGT